MNTTFSPLFLVIHPGSWNAGFMLAFSHYILLSRRNLPPNPRIMELLTSNLQGSSCGSSLRQDSPYANRHATINEIGLLK